MAFSLWAKGYKKEIHDYEEGDEYPIAGYHELLDEVYQRVRDSGAQKVFEFGFRTGIITKRLYEDGLDIVGVDTNESMVEAARIDMPNGCFLHEDYEMGLPSELLGETFDLAFSTYAVYNMDDVEKVRLMEEVLEHVKPGGKVIVGGIGFDTREQKKACMKANKDLNFKCDFPMIKTEILKDYPDATWTTISKCAGILEIQKEK